MDLTELLEEIQKSNAEVKKAQLCNKEILDKFLPEFKRKLFQVRVDRDKFYCYLRDSFTFQMQDDIEVCARTRYISLVRSINALERLTRGNVEKNTVFAEGDNLYVSGEGYSNDQRYYEVESFPLEWVAMDVDELQTYFDNALEAAVAEEKAADDASEEALRRQYLVLKARFENE